MGRRKRLPDGTEAPSVVDQHIVNVKDYIEQNYTKEELSLEKISDALSFNSRYLSRIFKKISGMNFTRHVNQVRIERAKEALISSTKSVSEIAYAVGFSNLSYFNYVFKRLEKCTPLNFRRNKRAQISAA